MMSNDDQPHSNANATNSRKRRRVVKLTVMSLSDIRVRVPPTKSSAEQLTVGEGGAYHMCKEKRPTPTAGMGGGVSSVSPLPEHFQPFLDKVGLGLNVGSSYLTTSGDMQQSEIHPDQRGNLSLSAAVSFTGSCPPQHMHVLSPSLCSKTGRMIVESDPVLRHGEDVADHSIHSATHEPDGTIAHVLVAKWDGAVATEDFSTADGQRNDISDSETAATGGAVSTESSKSEHWRRRRESTFRRKGSSTVSQPHMTVNLEHRSTTDSGSAKVYSTTASNSVRNSMSPLQLPPTHSSRNRIERENRSQQQEEERGEEADEEVDMLEGKNENDDNVFRTTDGDSLPLVLRGIPSPPPSPTNGSRPPSPILDDSAVSTKPAPPVSNNLPDIIELNVDLLVGRDLASNVDGDSGGMLQPQDNAGSTQPVGGIAHLKLFPKDMPADCSNSVLELPVRKKSQPSTAHNRVLSEVSNGSHPIVELGNNALLRVRIEIDSPKIDMTPRDDDANGGSAIQWTLSGASAAVKAGVEEADGEEVSLAKLADASKDQGNDMTVSDLLASDGATGRRGMGAQRVPGAFCSGLSDIGEMWGAFTKKCVLHCVDHCDDDALVYVNDGGGGDSLGSTIDTVYENIMY